MTTRTKLVEIVPRAIHLPELPRAPPLAKELRRLFYRQGCPHPVDEMKLSHHLKVIQEIDDRAIPGFVTSSKDQRLLSLAQKHGCTFMSSTSAMTSVLTHLHFLLSKGRGVNLSPLSHHFRHQDASFAPSAVKPISVFIRPVAGGVYAIDSDPGIAPAENQILMDLGKILEVMATKEAHEFQNLLPNPKADIPSTQAESFNFLQIGQMIIRSQIDAFDESTGLTLDIKSRATTRIRYDVKNYLKHRAYRLKFMEGPTESYEKEMYDMIRTVFPKYAFQMRLGQMNGALVMYHNTSEVYGYEYITLERIDEFAFGSSAMANKGFTICSSLAQIVFEDAIRRFPSGTVHVSTWYNSLEGYMEIIVAPVTNDRGWYEKQKRDISEDSEPSDNDCIRVELPEGAVRLRLSLSVFKNKETMFETYEFGANDDIQVQYEISEIPHAYMPYAMARWGDGYHPDFFTFASKP